MSEKPTGKPDAPESFGAFMEADRQKEGRQIADARKWALVAAIVNPEERLAVARAIVEVVPCTRKTSTGCIR
jgi:hypothetical protein